MKELESALRPVKRRMRTQRTFIWAMYGLFAGAVSVLLLRAASFVWAFPTVVFWSLVTLVALPAVFALIAWLWPITSLDAARQADALGLMARAQTAVMLGGCDTDMARLQRKDALSSLKRLQPARQMALRVPRLAWIGTAVCVVLVGVSFLIPNPQAQAIREQEAFHAEMMEQAQKVDEGATALDAGAAETPELRKLLGDLSGELRRAENVRDALTAVDTAERKVESLEARTARDALDAMRAAGLNTLAQSLEDGDTLAAQQALETEGTKELLSDAAAKASDQTAAQQLSRAAQALASGEARQALSALAAAASGQTDASAQALALTGMVRGAAARSGVQSAQGTIASLAHSGAGQQGASDQEGQGQPGGGASLGSSDGDGGADSAQPGTPVQGTASPEKKVADYEAIYDPTRLGASGEVHSERGQTGEGEILEAQAGNGAGSLEGTVPYRQALPQYREAAVEAAQDADLPAYARQWVETYFNALAQ
ncbi:MAG TPA: hypothetical protein IAC11_01890 [Candidatus Limiplasma pullicola]|nr:hypothetical protein [Candidatus Limiplasma pullicola]